MANSSWKQEWIDDAVKDRWFVAVIVNIPVLIVAYGAAAASAWVRRRRQEAGERRVEPDDSRQALSRPHE